MNREYIDRLARAVLYEGYILYPYRPSVKNRQRWTFGGVYPEAYARNASGTEASSNQTECLIRGTPETAVQMEVRYLHLISRQVHRFPVPLAQWTYDQEFLTETVDSLEVGGKIYYSWQEAEEKEHSLSLVTIGSILEHTLRVKLMAPARQSREPLRDAQGSIPGFFHREQHEITAEASLSAIALTGEVFRLTARVENITQLEHTPGREEALLHSLVSMHLVLGVRGGQFLSQLDPPEDCQQAAAACRNLGLFPVLVGEDNRADTMLASPIILYDYPQVAPESPGDLFDATEIDEILTLRVLTMTDEEKRQAAAIDERVRSLLARTESLGESERNMLHGTMRRANAPCET